MNLPFYIAKQIATNKQSTFSKFILRLATVATALSVAVMIVAISVVQGFKTKIRDKMFVFWGHAQVTMFNANPSSLIGDAPFDNDAKLVNEIKNTPGVKSVYPFVLKPAIIKAEDGLEGIKLKGVEATYPMDNTDAIGFAGTKIQFPDSGFSQDLVLSQATMDRLKLEIGAEVLLVFFDPNQTGPSVRKLKVVGTFHTGMEEVDQGFGFCDINLLRYVNKWSANDVSALQVEINNYQQAEKISEAIYQAYIKPPMSISSIKEIYPFIFTWLDFQNTNAALILTIMAVIAAINMATALLIYILERTQMVGTLKALGMPNRKIQSIFLYHAARVSLRGILWGTAIGLLLCYLQYSLQIVKLDESVYYMKHAPVVFDWVLILLVNIGTLLFCTILMFLPALIVRSVKIVNALKYR